MNRINPANRTRRGMTLIEVGIATILMTALATTLAQGLLTMHAQRGNAPPASRQTRSRQRIAARRSPRLE